MNLNWTRIAKIAAVAGAISLISPTIAWYSAWRTFGSFDVFSFLSEFLFRFFLVFAITLIIVEIFVEVRQTGSLKVKQIEEGTLSSKLAAILSNWKFWIVIFSILSVTLVAFLGPMAIALFPLTLLLGFASLLDKLTPIVSQTGVLKYFIDIFGFLLLMFYWPFILLSLFLILKRRVNTRLIITLSLIVLLLLIMGFYGCVSAPPIGTL